MNKEYVFPLKEILRQLKIKRQTFAYLNEKYHIFKRIKLGVYRVDIQKMNLLVKYYEQKKEYKNWNTLYVKKRNRIS